MSLSFDALLSRLAIQKLPKPGARLELEPLAGSADALAVAQLAGRGRMLVVITANPLDAQRLHDEIAQRGAQVDLHADGELVVDGPVFELAVRCAIEDVLRSSPARPRARPSTPRPTTPSSTPRWTPSR